MRGIFGRRLIFFIVLIVVSLPSIPAQSVWEGNAAVSRYGELPATGFFAASNTFPINSLISVTSVSNGKSVTLYIISSLSDSGIFLLLSPQAAQELGVEKGTVVPVRVTKAQVGELSGAIEPTGKAKTSLPDITASTSAASSAPASSGSSSSQGTSLNPNGKSLLESIRQDLRSRGTSGNASPTSASVASASKIDGTGNTASTGASQESLSSTSAVPKVLSAPTVSEEPSETPMQPAVDPEKKASVPEKEISNPVPNAPTSVPINPAVTSQAEPKEISSAVDPADIAQSLDSRPQKGEKVPPLMEKPLAPRNDAAPERLENDTVSNVSGNETDGEESGSADSVAEEIAADSLPIPRPGSLEGTKPLIPDVTILPSTAEADLAPHTPGKKSVAVPPVTPEFRPPSQEAEKPSLSKPAVVPDSRITLEPAEPRPPEASTGAVSTSVTGSKEAQAKTAATTEDAAGTMPKREAPEISGLVLPAPASAGTTASGTNPELPPVRRDSAVPEKRSTPTVVSAAAPEEQLKLRKGENYLQLGAYSSREMVQKMAGNISPSIPTVIIPSGTEGRQVFKLFVGPIREDESGLLLRTLRSSGFKDAYLKKGE